MASKELSKKEENNIKQDVIKSIKEKVLNDVEKEMNSTIKNGIESYKNDFKEEISNQIQEEISGIMKREEKRISRSKSFTIFKKNVFILLLLALVGYFGYCLYDVRYFDFMKADCEKNGTCTTTVAEEKPKEEVVVKDKDWYITNYGYLLEDTQLNLSADKVSSYYLYSSDHKLKNIKANYLLTLAYKKLDKNSIKVNSSNVIIKAEDMKNAFMTMFGSLDNYKNVAFSYGCLNFTYNESKDRFIAENIKCNESTKEIVEKIMDMYEDGQDLYILTTAAIYDNSEQSFYTFDNLFDPVETSVVKDDIEEYVKKLNRYQYHFKKIDNLYYLEEITKVK